MSFSDNFIKKPVLTTVCSILIVLVGLIAIPTLPIAKLIQLSSGLAAASGPPAVPGFSSQGGFYFQFNDLSNGQYNLNELSDLADPLIKEGNASGDFSTLYTQFNPSSPAVGLSINRR